MCSGHQDRAGRWCKTIVRECDTPICGIAADYGVGQPHLSWIHRALGRLAHRGPDDAGTARVGNTLLGHRRLSIVDVAGGRQPLSAGDAQLVGNGEIYNHEELRGQLTGPFATRSDNEVVLHLLRERGPRGLSALRGMYACCATLQTGRFVALRDPVGIKPLYWARRDRRVRFASEMRAFDRDWRPSVEVFPPGHYWTPDTGLVRFAAVDRPLDTGTVPSGREPGREVVAAVRDLVTTAVERRMMADVPVGVFLSGGLDSSLVAAVAAAHARRNGRRLRTFAVGLAGSPDLAAARTVAQHLGTDHREQVYTPDEAVGALPAVIAAIESDEPSLVRSAVPNYLLAELAARHVKVVLTGEGADELFAGYDYLRGLDDDPAALHDELVRIVEGLHHLNLQRCDRVTMAHGLEARVPFLDLDVIGLGLALPGAWKRAGPGRMEKHLLRSAFAGDLPEEVVSRPKAQFGDGSGARDVLAARAEATVSDRELVEARRSDPATAPRSKEDLAYRRELRRHLDGIRTDRVLGRFATA